MEPVIVDGGPLEAVAVWFETPEHQFVDLLSSSATIAQNLVLHLQGMGVKCGWRKFGAHICLRCGAEISCNCPKRDK